MSKQCSLFGVLTAASLLLVTSLVSFQLGYTLFRVQQQQPPHDAGVGNAMVEVLLGSMTSTTTRAAATTTNHHGTWNSAATTITNDPNNTMTSTTDNNDAGRTSIVVRANATTTTMTSALGEADRGGDIVTVFYHVYIPLNDPAGRQRALRIVREQIGLVRRSYAASLMLERLGRPLRILYNTVGDRVGSAEMQAICNAPAYENLQIMVNDSTYYFAPVRCEFGAHYRSGFEFVTLQSVHSYCRQDPFDDVRLNTTNNQAHSSDSLVIYMHNKGSYHSSKGANDRWRPHLTQAATSQKCVDSLLNDDGNTGGSNNNNNNTCNACGLQFWPVWTTFFPGNFWTAKCSYVSKLLPPEQFSERMSNATNHAWRDLTRRDERFVMRLYNPFTPGVLMVGRYSAEHWIASHPSIVPCDLSTIEVYMYWLETGEYYNDETRRFRWSMAPRHPLEGSYWLNMDRQKLPVILNNTHLRMREYFLLPGKLYQWMKLYGTVPPDDSWVWWWYPDGEEWKNAVAEHGGGMRAVEVLTQRAKPKARSYNVTTRSMRRYSSSLQK